jgi:hypothetical protein
MSAHAHFKALDRYPVVECPGCKVAMALINLRAVLPSDNQYCGTYRCEQCGTDTQRQFKRPPQRGTGMNR